MRGHVAPWSPDHATWPDRRSPLRPRARQTLKAFRTGAAGFQLYGAAFEQLTGLPMRVRAPMAGRLDPDILRDTILAHDLDPAGYSFARFATVLAAAYASGAARLRAGGRALPGAGAALAAFAGTPLTVQTVLTGNIRPVSSEVACARNVGL